MPQLDLTKVNCNYSNFPHHGKVIIANKSQTQEIVRGLQNPTLAGDGKSEEKE